MFIAQTYSHKGALEELQGTDEWKEIESSINAVKLCKHKCKVSKEKNREGEMLISPSSVNESLAQQFSKRGWGKKRRTPEPPPCQLELF